MPLSNPAPLVPYAARAEKTRGRLHEEAESATRTPFQRDRDRIIHAVAFRRLMHKTQVFIAHEGDHFRTRLTHSLEVAQIARSLARMMQLDEDLAECLALAHDLGHSPFGHTGEDVLAECMAPYGGFDHNAQTLRILTKLEKRHAAFDGLNLTWETLEGVVKHNGPLQGALAERLSEAGEIKPLTPLPAALTEYAQMHDLWLETFPGLEAQIAALADDIAYNNHDVDDGLRAGVFTLEEALHVPVIGEAIATCRQRFPDTDQNRLIAEAVSEMIGRMVRDVAAETQARLAVLAPKTADDIRQAERAVVAFSDDMHVKVSELRTFLWQKMYRHWKVNRARSHAKRVTRDLFDLFMSEPEVLPPEWHRVLNFDDDAKKARAICDYIAGMTDRFALLEHKRLFDAGAWM
ncbi:MAG: deoxyguanosinetriphosphate triphosphohydrolase [bacterium]